MPELYEVVGSILRDIAQARCLSDLYSRDISRYYAVDEVLRNFPVPRAEINEASFTLSFVIDGVTVDETRQNIRNARLSQVFERSASEIVRSALATAREVVDKIGSRTDLKPEQRAALDAFASGFLSEEYRIILRARFVRYFEENRAAFIADESLLRTKAVTDIKAFVEGLSADPLMQRALAQFPGDRGAQLSGTARHDSRQAQHDGRRVQRRQRVGEGLQDRHQRRSCPRAERRAGALHDCRQDHGSQLHLVEGGRGSQVR